MEIKGIIILKKVGFILKVKRLEEEIPPLDLFMKT